MTLDEYIKELDEYFANTSKDQLMIDLMKAGVEFYKPNTFFVFPEDKESFLWECIAESDKTWVDQLDCRISPARQSTDLSVGEVMDIGLHDPKTHYTFIFRQGYGQPDYFETGLSTIGNSPDYFLWINLSVEQGLKMIEKWGLKEWENS